MKLMAIIVIVIQAGLAWGDPSFSGPLAIDAFGPADIVIDDITQDGSGDLVYGGNLAVNNWDALSTFTLIPTGVTLSGDSIDIGQIDNRNSVDIVSTIYEGLYLAEDLGTSSPMFQRTALWGRLGQYGCAIGDFDNDGWNDIVATGSRFPPTLTQWVSVFENQGTSPTSFVRNDLDGAVTFQRYVAVADLNNDNKPDIITTSDFLLECRWNVTVDALAFDKDLVTSSTDPPYHFQKPVPVDFDHDGDVDILVNTRAEVMWLENLDPTSPTFARHVLYTDTTGDPISQFGNINIIRCKPLDFDLDGDMDIVATGRQLVVLENTGDNLIFIPHLIPTPPAVDYTYAVDAGDLNGDGYPDLAVSYHRMVAPEGMVVVYLNRFPLGPASAADWQLYK
jgi:hypothetical protein